VGRNWKCKWSELVWKWKWLGLGRGMERTNEPEENGEDYADEEGIDSDF